MRRVTRDGRGRWVVAAPVEGETYGTVHGKRRLYRIPVGPDADRGHAESVARALGMIGEEVRRRA